ncbi:MAG: flagellar biosynthesis protein FlhA [Aquabacterium sp.]|uniref:flagellar biosynthesis protein FlhA n=1 Tax=Aquabacterium sp. TaxID=1872578 RepID=UPI0027236D46|nr:flagellar biosynthesis protein FlhA [Aquabacterium sp.]MDO9005748.1 flagellar biosynthesis protein FlhA [Aquabacterium sp.]
MTATLRRFFGKNADLALVALVMGILLVLFAPIPAGLLDFLILMNVGFALLILLVTFYAPRPVEFSTFPAILLVATLFRLALNVSATRLILSEGDAGHVIGAVGSYVVAGNYVIGLIVFLILVVVQYVVVTSGAQRVSEVAARFTLDSMPGQQMSIDADLNMGFIDQDEAKRRRKNLEREAAFYGSMDGASKFVKGDAVAGIIIMLINIIGGLVIGVLQMGMPWGEALRHYTLLTIGDGIVTQVPALVVSVGTGLIVTRSASDSMLGLEVFRQITAYPRTLVMVALSLLGIACLPGMPIFPPLVLVAGLIVMYFLASSRKKDGADAPEDKDAASDDPYDLAQVEPVEMMLGSGLAQMLGGAEKTVLLERVAEFRKQFAHEIGFVLPKVKFKDGASLQPNQYEIAVFGDTVAMGAVMPEHILAIHPTGNTTLVKGIETRDPSYGLPALWIEPAQRDAARAAKYTLVDPATVLVTHLSETLRQQASGLLTRTETDKMLARLRVAQPGLVEELVPTLLSVGDVQKVVQHLMREKVPIRNLQAIVEALIDGAKATKDAGLLVEMARQRLATTICNTLSADKKVLHVMTLHPEIEGQLLRSVSVGESDKVAMVDPRLSETLLLKLAQQSERMMKNSMTPVLLCPVELRRHVRALSERAIPHLRVLSVAEVPVQFELRAFSSVSLQP